MAKWSRAQDQFDRLSAVADLLQTLHQQGARVVPPLISVDARHRVIIDTGSAPLSIMVQPEIDGALLDITDETSVRRAGACLAELHNALAEHPDRRLIDAEPGSLDLHQRIEGTASARLRDQIASLPPIDREPQLIHGDFRASNVLAAGSEILAVIDFDSVSWDYRVSDLANVYFGTHFVDWQPTPPSVRDTLLDGYQSVRPLSRLEHRWLQALVLWQSINAGWADAL